MPRTKCYLAVTLLDTGQFVGVARLGLNGVNAAKLGYAIAADHWGNGYASDAARTLIKFGFAELGLHRISAAIGPDNAASIALAERLGVQYEGRIPQPRRHHGTWRDSLLYAVLSGEEKV